MPIPFPGSYEPLNESSSEGLIHSFIPSPENSAPAWEPMSAIQTQVGSDFTFANVPISDLPEDFVQELVIRSEDSLKGLSVRHLQNELPRCFRNGDFRHFAEALAILIISGSQ